MSGGHIRNAIGARSRADAYEELTHMATTKAPFQQVRDVAKRHVTTAETYDQLERNVQTEVDLLLSRNRGDLMTKLDALQNEWSPEIKDVINKIREMGNYLYDVANKLEAQDAASGGGLN